MGVVKRTRKKKCEIKTHCCKAAKKTAVEKTDKQRERERIKMTHSNSEKSSRKKEEDCHAKERKKERKTRQLN